MLKNLYLKYRFFTLFRRAMVEKSAWRETRALGRWAAEFLAIKKTWYRVVPGLL